jgi:4-aminobutyrate aminotransferase
VIPDLLCLGKGLASGMPLSACLGRLEVMESWPASQGEALHTQTFLGHPPGCAAALATLEVIESERLLERANRLGARALARLRQMRQRRPAVVDVRGVGLLLGIELAQAALAEDVMYRCLARGLSFKVGQGNVIVLAPPLIIEESDLEQALVILDQAIGEAAA